jgi:hypothetical protein
MRQAHTSRSDNHAGRRRAHAAIGIIGLALLTNAGCTLDERTLQTGDAIDGAGAQSGQAPAGNPSGAGAAAGETSAGIPKCSYVGSTTAPGCETLVDNPGFTKNVAGWTAEDLSISEGWEQEDAAKASGSGSIAVTNTNYSNDAAAKGGTAPGGARQCIPITGNANFDFAADIYIPAGQGAGYQGDGFPGNYVSFADLSAFFYPDTACAQQSEGKSFSTDAVQVAGEWVHVEGSAMAPKDAQSMAVRLATGKPFPQYMFEAHFDNILVRQSAAQ